MGGMALEYGALGSGDEAWTRLAELMRNTQQELSDAPAAGLAPSVRGAASSFLTAWAGYAGESAAIGDGLAEALRVLQYDVATTDEERQQIFRDLDGRLGPAR